MQVIQTCQPGRLRTRQNVRGEKNAHPPAPPIAVGSFCICKVVGGLNFNKCHVGRQIHISWLFKNVVLIRVWDAYCAPPKCSVQVAPGQREAVHEEGSQLCGSIQPCPTPQDYPDTYPQHTRRADDSSIPHTWSMPTDIEVNLKPTAAGAGTDQERPSVAGSTYFPLHTIQQNELNRAF